MSDLSEQAKKDCFRAAIQPTDTRMDGIEGGVEYELDLEGDVSTRKHHRVPDLFWIYTGP